MRNSIIRNIMKAFCPALPLVFFSLAISSRASLWPRVAASPLGAQSSPASNRAGGPLSDDKSGSTQESGLLSDFGWLAGDWQGVWGPRIVEQTWMAPKAGQMTGIYRVLENSKALVVELFSLLDTSEGIEFRFRHFTPELTPWEKDGPTQLRLASLDSKNAVFENPSAGQPKRALFIRVDPNTYISRSEIVAEDGSIQVTEITFHRLNIPSPPAAPKKGSKAKR